MAHKPSEKPRQNEREEGCVGGKGPGGHSFPLPNHHGMHERGKGGEKPEKPKGP